MKWYYKEAGFMFILIIITLMSVNC